MKLQIKYTVRITIATLIHYLIKFFDRSFSGALFDMDTRSLVFLLYFIIFTLLSWAGGEAIARSVEMSIGRKRSFNTMLLFTGLALCAYGVALSVLFGIGYLSIDVYLLDHIGYWTAGAFYNKELNVAVFFLFMLIVGFNAVAYYYKHWQQVRINNEKLIKENLQSRYAALVNQIDPHFFFNSLSVLTSIVYKDADLAADYITKLSRMYRYILDQKEKKTVKLKTELDFLQDYIFLMKIRFDNTIEFTIQLCDSTIDKVEIPPNTLQMLAENAVKHNRFSELAPLCVRISEQEGYITVVNNKNLRQQISKSRRIGLDNIAERYRLQFGKNIEVINTADEFAVKLPKWGAK